MKYNKFLLSFITFGALMIGMPSCSSDPSDEPEPPVLEEESVHNRRALCKRFNLPEDKILNLNEFYGFGKDNLMIFTGTNEDNELTTIVCDTIANKTLYANYNQLKLAKELEFSFPYGEKKTLPYSAFQYSGIAIDGSNLAAAYCAFYGEGGAMNRCAFIHYRFFYHNGNLTVVELPQLTETMSKRESVMAWYNGSSLFYYNFDFDNPDLKLVTCYDKNGNLCYEAKYPYIREGYESYDLLRADIIQPFSVSNGIGVNYSSGKIHAFAVNIEEQTLLWNKKDVVIESYEYKDNDRVELTNQQFKNNTLTFTVDVTKYSGSKQSFNVAVTTEGVISFPSNK